VTFLHDKKTVSAKAGKQTAKAIRLYRLTVGA
jgi:hypothetical protein